MKKFLLGIFILVFISPSQAKHIIGGEMIYEYMGAGTSANSSWYRITLKLFRDQNSPPDAAAMPANVFIGIYNNDNGSQFPNAGSFYDVLKSTEGSVLVNAFPECISNPPDLNYNAGIYI